MRTALFFALVAGSAISAPAFADEDIALPVESVRIVPREAYTGPVYPKEPDSRMAGLVYDNSDVTTLFTNAANPVLGTDDASLTPGNASALPGQVITAMSLGFMIKGTTGGGTRDFDVLVEFFDNYNAAAPAGSPVWTTSLGSFRTGFTGLLQNTAYTTDLINLTALPGGGIVLPDAGFGVQLKFVEPGKTTVVTGILVTHLFSSNFDDATATNKQTNGYSSSYTWRDTNGNGVVEATATERTTFPPPFQARFYMQLEGNARCSNDYNNDGFVDGIDYDLFNADFATLCY